MPGCCLMDLVGPWHKQNSTNSNNREIQQLGLGRKQNKPGHHNETNKQKSSLFLLCAIMMQALTDGRLYTSPDIFHRDTWTFYVLHEFPFFILNRENAYHYLTWCGDLALQGLDCYLFLPQSEHWESIVMLEKSSCHQQRAKEKKWLKESFTVGSICFLILNLQMTTWLYIIHTFSWKRVICIVLHSKLQNSGQYIPFLAIYHTDIM